MKENNKQEDVQNAADYQVSFTVMLAILYATIEEDWPSIDCWGNWLEATDRLKLTDENKRDVLDLLHRLKHKVS